MGDHKCNLCLHWASCANACGTNGGWRPFCFSVAQNLPRFDARVWPHFHVKTHKSPPFNTQIGMSTALFSGNKTIVKIILFSVVDAGLYILEDMERLPTPTQWTTQPVGTSRLTQATRNYLQ